MPAWHALREKAQRPGEEGRAVNAAAEAAGKEAATHH